MAATTYLGFVDLSEILGKATEWAMIGCLYQPLKEVPVCVQVEWDEFNGDSDLVPACV